MSTHQARVNYLLDQYAVAVSGSYDMCVLGCLLSDMGITVPEMHRHRAEVQAAAMDGEEG